MTPRELLKKISSLTINHDEDMVTALCYSSLSTVLGRVVKLQVA
jgi:hypothetical protein